MSAGIPRLHTDTPNLLDRAELLKHLKGVINDKTDNVIRQVLRHESREGDHLAMVMIAQVWSDNALNR